MSTAPVQPPSIRSVTHLAWSHSLPASQWASLIHQLAQKETLSSAEVEQAILAALVPPPTFYHQSLLSAALASTPSLLRPQALLVSALAPTSSPPSAALWSLLLPYSALLSISDTPSAATSRLLDLLISTDTRIPALVDLATRLLGSSVLPASAAEQATALYAALNAVPRPDSYTIDLKAIVERAVAQLVAIGGGVGLLPAAPLDSATAVRGGLEERVLGALETDVQSMMKDPSDAAGSEPGAEQAQSSRRLAEIILDALILRAPGERSQFLRAVFDHLEAAFLGGREELARVLLEAGLVELSHRARATRSLVIGQLPGMLAALQPIEASTLIDSLLRNPDVEAALERIDKYAASQRPPGRRSSRMEGVEEESDSIHDEHHDDSSDPRPSLPPIRLDLLHALAEVSLLEPSRADEFGVTFGEGVRASALVEGEMLGYGDLPSYWSHICGSSTSARDRQKALAVDRVLSLDFVSQNVLAEVFFETWRTACFDKNIGLLASLCETLLASETRGLVHALLEWAATGFDAVRALIRDGINFLETFDDEGYGDSQSTLLQYAQISACIQLLVRRHSLEREKLGDVDGRSISAAFFGQAAMVQPIGALNEDEKDLLGGWVTALFGSEGIADDLLQSTAPRMLFKLATTLVSQALAAYQRKMIDLDTLKAGLSYFTQPFLAWQLTGIVPWLLREIQRVGSRGGAHLRVMEGLLLETGCPPAVLELHGRAILDLLAEPTTKSMPGGAIDADAIRRLLSTTPTDEGSLGPGQTWAQAVDGFANYFVSPSSNLLSSTAAPATSLPRLLKFAGSSAVLSSLWNALLSPVSPSAGALDRFAALLGLSVSGGGLLETFLIQFVPQAQANLPDGRLPLLEDVVRRVVKLAMAVDGKERIGVLTHALGTELRGPRFNASTIGAKAARNGVLGAVEKAVGIAA